MIKPVFQMLLALPSPTPGVERSTKKKCGQHQTNSDTILDTPLPTARPEPASHSDPTFRDLCWAEGRGLEGGGELGPPSPGSLVHGGGGAESEGTSLYFQTLGRETWKNEPLPSPRGRVPSERTPHHFQHWGVRPGGRSHSPFQGAGCHQRGPTM